MLCDILFRNQIDTYMEQRVFGNNISFLNSKQAYKEVRNWLIAAIVLWTIGFSTGNLLGESMNYFGATALMISLLRFFCKFYYKELLSGLSEFLG